jgi:predicted dehydrogenase
MIGAGYMGQLAHLTYYADLPGVEVVALAENRPRTAALVASRFGIPKVYDDHREMLAEEDLDAVIAVTAFAWNFRIIPDVLEAGVHLLTEKPMCIDPANGRSFAAAARERDLIYHVGYMKRADPAAVEAKKTVSAWRESGTYGDLRYLRVTMPPGYWQLGAYRHLDAGDPRPEFPMEHYPKSIPLHWRERYIAFINYYIHQVNFIRYVLSEDYAITYVDPTGVLLIAESESGVPITLEMAPYHIRDEWQEDVLIGFDHGWIDLSLPAPLARHPGTITLNRDAGDRFSRERLTMPPTWAMRAQAERFIAEVRGERPNLSPPEDAVKDLEISIQYIQALSDKVGEI